MGRSGKWKERENNFSGSSNVLLSHRIFIDRASFQSFYNFKLTTLVLNCMEISAREDNEENDEN